MKLDDEYDIVDKYNNIYHRTIKVKPIDDGLYIKGDVFGKFKSVHLTEVSVLLIFFVFGLVMIEDKSGSFKNTF